MAAAESGRRLVLQPLSGHPRGEARYGRRAVAVIAMDCGSLDSEELAPTPRVLFGP